jgi:hypothetical protein
MRRAFEFIGIGLVLLIAGNAHARGVPASAGRAVFGSQDSCFNLSNSMVINTCSVDVFFEIPVEIDTSSSKGISIYGKRNGANTLQCAPLGMDQVGNVVSNPGFVAWANNASAVLQLGNVFVPSAGYMFVQCLIGPGSKVGRVDFFAP